MTTSYHIPVLLSEVIQNLSVEPNAWYIDGTLGGGGYSLEILRHDGKIVGIDTDTDALEYTSKRFKYELPEKQEGKDWILIHDNFRNVEAIVKSLSEVVSPQGMVLDLGVSSHQIDEKTRGFSYRFEDAPLDMRMNQQTGIPASTVINTYSKEDLYDIFTTYGEEERSRSIVDAITDTRHVKKFETVGDVIHALDTVKKDDRTLARIFQALRIEVNDELKALEEGLTGAEHILPMNGKLVVVSFHSLEDRIVKRFFRKPVWKKTADAIRATEIEQEKNSRSKSAKLRAAQKR